MIIIMYHYDFMPYLPETILYDIAYDLSYFNKIKLTAYWHVSCVLKSLNRGLTFCFFNLRNIFVLQSINIYYGSWGLAQEDFNGLLVNANFLWTALKWWTIYRLMSKMKTFPSLRLCGIGTLYSIMILRICIW
jgi:hypothetical protein